METPYDLLCEVLPGRETWKFKVRVVRLWPVYSFLKPGEINGLEMVLIDEKGGNHASIRKQLLYLFDKKIKEGDVYKLSHFAIAPSVGAYRPTLHPYKLIFQMKTKIQIYESPGIPLFGFSFTELAVVSGYDADFGFLIDVIGVMTEISSEREYVRDGKVIKMVVIELTDESGKCECALFGEYVDELQILIGKNSAGCPVVAIQFAKVKIFRDTIGVLVTCHFDVLEFSPGSNNPVVKFEIADQSGRFACALMGKYVNEFREYLSNSPSKHPVVILQFAKISFERGYVCLENYKEVTRVMFNASIREVYHFNTRLSNAGGVHSLIRGIQRKSVVVSDITPFDSFYPHKSVREFIDTPESGFFVLCARVVGIFHLNSCWYPACKCGKFLDICAGCYFCDKCNIHIYAVSSMFKLQIGIDDGTSTVLIQTTYSPLRGIHSLNHSLLGMEHALSHYGSKAFEGKEVLLIVRKFARSEYRFEDHVEIINMTDEEGSILRFHELGSDFTPTKSIASTSFTDFQMDYNKRETISSAIQTVVNGKKPLIESNSPNHLPCLTVGTISKSRSNKAKKRLLSSLYEVDGECSYMNSK